MGAEIWIRRHPATEPHHHQRLTAESHRKRLIRQLIRPADRMPRSPQRALQRRLSRRIQLVPWRFTHLRECMAFQVINHEVLTISRWLATIKM
jgi:hypothetical protein